MSQNVNKSWKNFFSLFFFSFFFLSFFLLFFLFSFFSFSFLFLFFSFFFLFSQLNKYTMEWVQLFEHLCEVNSTDRIFHANFGVSPLICAQVWEKLLVSYTQGPFPFRKKHLLWTLCFLKTYETNDSLSTKFGEEEKTFRKWVWRMLETLYEHLDEVNRILFTIPT